VRRYKENVSANGNALVVLFLNSVTYSEDRRPGGNRGPLVWRFLTLLWIPAFAGMTAPLVAVMKSDIELT
jgi:hypothetical protein